MPLFLLFCFNNLLKAQTGKINTDQTRLRSCDDRNCQTIKRIDKGTKFAIIGRGKCGIY